MKPLPAQRTEQVFKDYKAPYGQHQATAEANRCLYCFEPPCVGSCPAGIDIPAFIRKIKTGNLRGAARIIFGENPLGMSCARVCPVEVLCVGSCVFGAAGIPPIQIGRLQRYATDQAFEKGWQLFERGAPTGRRIALIGAGPASLACAWELARLGNDCVIFEQRGIPGGLATTGIAPYKMKSDRALQEVEWVLGMGGIEVRYDQEVGRDIDLHSLEKDFDAVFVGVGLGPDKWMDRLPGAHLPGIEGGVQFIERLKTSQVDLGAVKSAIVIGGGNTGVDAMRELLALGVPNVHLVYRRTEADMKGYAHEWQVARQMGARASWSTLPQAFEGEGRVQSVRCVQLDRDLQVIPGSEISLPADLVLMAIGQVRIGDALAAMHGIQVEGGIVKVDAQRFTGRPGWYAGGDCVNGGKEVVNAAADGKTAARAIHATLSASQEGASNA